jgi:outer membrane protein W
VLSANGQQLDNAYYGNTDSSIFTTVNTLSGAPISPDSITTKNFILRQEFSFIGLPLMIQYQPAEHRFTPYMGLGFSAGYILKERVMVNGKELGYNYWQSTNTIVFFGEAQAGVKYRISNHLFLKLQPSLRYGLNSLSGDDNIKWIPYSAGIGAGINFRF